MAADTAPLLSVRDLSVGFATARGLLPAVEGVSFDLAPGETLGLVGESGSGKSSVALALVGLLPKDAARVGGQVLLDGRDLLTLPERALRQVRGGEAGMIFQDPMMSLNPTMTVGRQIAEPLRIHRGMAARAARSEALALLERVGIPDPVRRLDAYPHELSGGQRQRVMIAIALACRPRLLIADEPTTALDVTVQAQILDLIRALSRETGTAVVLITHDLGIAAEMCDRIGVMYAGRLVETAPAGAVFRDSRMPYTRALLRAIPRLAADQPKRLAAIPGTPPSPLAGASGCRFAPRCADAAAPCSAGEPPLSLRGPSHAARCWGTEPQGWLR